MGEKYEVMEWCKDITNGEDYSWVQEYYGRSLISALFKLYKLKRQGSFCIKLIVR